MKKFSEITEDIIKNEVDLDKFKNKSFRISKTLIYMKDNPFVKDSVDNYFQKIKDNGENIEEYRTGRFALTFATDKDFYNSELKTIYRISINSGAESPRQKLCLVIQPKKTEFIVCEAYGKLETIKIEELPKLETLQSLIFKNLITEKQALSFEKSIQKELKKDNLYMRDNPYENIGIYEGKAFIIDPDTVNKISKNLLNNFIENEANRFLKFISFNINKVLDYISGHPKNKNFELDEVVNFKDIKSVTNCKLAVENVKNLGLPSPFIATQSYFSKCVTKLTKDTKQQITPL